MERDRERVGDALHGQQRRRVLTAFKRRDLTSRHMSRPLSEFGGSPSPLAPQLADAATEREGFGTDACRWHRGSVRNSEPQRDQKFVVRPVYFPREGSRMGVTQLRRLRSGTARARLVRQRLRRRAF